MGDDPLAPEGGDDESARSEPRGATGRRPYGESAEAAVSRPMVNLLPARFWTIALAALATMVPVGLALVAHALRPRIAAVVGPESASAFDLAADRNVSQWWAGTMLTAAALVGMWIYSLRRHRVDDYHGRYRAWIWFAAGCLLASLGETSNAGLLARDLVRRSAEWSGVSAAIVWPAALGGMLSLAGVRMLFEIWRCRAAVALLTIASAGFVLAAATRHDLLPIASGAEPLVERGSWLTGYVVLLVMLLVYTNRVRAEIEGRIALKPAERKPRKKKKPASVTRRDEAQPEQPRKPVRTDLDNPAPNRPGPEKIPMRPQVSSAGSSFSSDQRHLSRAERRRLRREGSDRREAA